MAPGSASLPARIQSGVPQRRPLFTPARKRFSTAKLVNDESKRAGSRAADHEGKTPNELPAYASALVSEHNIPISKTNPFADPTMTTFILWLLLFVFCWPLALLALILYPILWLLLLPFRLVGIAVGGVFEFLGALFMLPARVLRRLA